MLAQSGVVPGRLCVQQSAAGHVQPVDMVAGRRRTVHQQTNKPRGLFAGVNSRRTRCTCLPYEWDGAGAAIAFRHVLPRDDHGILQDVGLWRCGEAVHRSLANSQLCAVSLLSA